ncbi:MAG TPA: hypothetical protein ENG51_08925 [Deltaproteobacteria bacterium]|nr:hypothetical protein [Deltaproteobacteria bacterium]
MKLTRKWQLLPVMMDFCLRRKFNINMKIKKAIVFLILLSVSLISYRAFCEELPEVGKVVWVDDGDTFVLEGGEKVRLLGINCPEKPHKDKPGECFGYEATRFAIKLLKRKKVRLEYDRIKRDRYHRLLAYVFLPSGEMANAIIVRKGFGYVLTVPPNKKYRARLLRAQRLALDENLGMWKHCKPEKEEYYYIGNLRSYIFHRPSCKFGKMTSSKNVITFSTRKQAFYQGFAPCRRCKP